MATQASDATLRGGFPDELAIIAHRAQAFTNASGTAIALSEGSADEIICRARAGASAPEVGTALRLEGTFTGLCIQSGKELCCDDAETDSRVDKAAVRALGIRSMVAIPIKKESRVVGVLAIFAPAAHAFSITHVAVLKTLADQIAAYLERKQRDEAYPPKPLPAPSVKALAASAAASPAAPSPAEMKAAAPSPIPRHVPAAPKIEPARSRTFTEDIDRLPQITPVTRAPERLDPAQSGNRETNSQDEEKATKSHFWSAFRRVDAASARGKRTRANVLIIEAAAVVVIAMAVGLALKLRRPAAAAQPATESSSSSAAAAAPAPAFANVQPSAKNAPSSPTANREEAQPRREATVLLSARPSKISGRRDNSAPAYDATAVFLGSGPASGSLSSLANPISQPSRPKFLAPSDLEPVTVLKKVPPVYPLVARQRRLSGSVVVQGTVGKNGRISDLRLISGPPLFRDAAFEAVKQWVFKPARLNGQAIEQSTRIQLDFGGR